MADDFGACRAFLTASEHVIPKLPVREWHVAEKGRDGSLGTLEQPLQTIQLAVERARPGDQIIVHPGVYPNPVKITRGGTKEKPIVIRAAKKWQAILHSNR